MQAAQERPLKQPKSGFGGPTTDRVAAGSCCRVAVGCCCRVAAGRLAAGCWLQSGCWQTGRRLQSGCWQLLACWQTGCWPGFTGGFSGEAHMSDLGGIKRGKPTNVLAQKQGLIPSFISISNSNPTID